MLGFDEISGIARLKRISMENAEKDYLQDLILLSIYSIAGRELVFKGGTCLYKVYKLNRFSEDLDFTAEKKADWEKLGKRVISDMSMLNIRGRVKEADIHKNEANIRILINGPLYKGSRETQCFIPLNISMREKCLLEPKAETIRPIYREIFDFEVFAMQEKEILAEKIRAVCTRLKPRDVYDLWFLLIRRGIEFDVELADKKLALYGLKFDKKEFISRIEKMKGMWETDLRNLAIGQIEDFNKVKKEIIAKI